MEASLKQKVQDICEAKELEHIITVHSHLTKMESIYKRGGAIQVDGIYVASDNPAELEVIAQLWQQCDLDWFKQCFPGNAGRHSETTWIQRIDPQEIQPILCCVHVCRW